MSRHLSASLLKAASLSGVVLLASISSVLAQTDTTVAPQLPLSPTTEVTSPSLQTQQDSGLPIDVTNQPASLNIPSAGSEISTDTASTLPPAVKAESTTALASENPNPESETELATTEGTANATEQEIAPLQTTTEQVEAAAKRATTFLQDGGPSIWAIAALSVITVALILWKIWRLALIGAWARGKAQKAVTLYEDGNTDAAQALVSRRKGLRSKVVGAAITARETLTEDAAREETARVAKRELGEAAVGLRALELIATIAPLLGLLGTVLGMIAAFQALQESGSRADPSLLAGGIWEALLTTAAGMAVAIPASAALTWFEAVIDRMRRDVEDAAMRIFVTRKEANAITVQALAAE